MTEIDRNIRLEFPAAVRSLASSRNGLQNMPVGDDDVLAHENAGTPKTQHKIRVVYAPNALNRAAERLSLIRELVSPIPHRAGSWVWLSVAYHEGWTRAVSPHDSFE